MSKLKEKELEKFLNNLWTDFKRILEGIIIQHEAKGYHEKADEVRKQLKKNEQAYKQIVTLIKIFCAKEISEGPIKEDIPGPDLIEWLQGINQSATAVKDYYVMKATTQLIEMLRNYDMVQEYLDGARSGIGVTKEFIEEKVKQLYTEIGIQYREILQKVNIEDFIRRLLEEAQGMGEGWLPTPENINALPEPVRDYIIGLTGNCDPAGMVQENALLRDTCKALEIKLKEKVQVHDELLIKYTEKFREDYERGFCSRNNYKGRLKQFSQEAGLEVVKK